MVEQGHHSHAPLYGLNRYESSWTSHEDFASVVLDLWLQTDHSHGDFSSLHQKLGCCMRTVKRWSRHKTQVSDHQLHLKIHRLDDIRSNLIASIVEEAQQLKMEIRGIQQSLHLKWK